MPCKSAGISKIKKHKFEEVILWCYSPSSCDIVEKIPYKSLVYDCIDRHSGYAGFVNPTVVDSMEEDLAKKASIVFTTAVGLQKTLEDYNNKCYMIPNGCAYELFSSVHSKTFETPEKLKKAKGKIYGFIGMLQECIAYDYIEELAKACPNDTIVFVGKTLPGVNLEHLEKYDNIIFCGLVPQIELPAYISMFDVCLNTFSEGKLSKDVSPLKFYEYLATGKPIVSTKEPSQVMDFASCIYIAQDKESFVSKCKEAINEKGDIKLNLRMEYAKKCSWSERVKQMHTILQTHEIY